MYTQIEPSFAYTPDALIVQCRNELDARLRVQGEYEKWSNLAAMFSVPEALLKYKKGRKAGAFRVIARDRRSQPSRSALSEFSGILSPNALHIESPITLSPGLIRALNTIADNPEEQWFLHRISSDLNRMTQIAVSESAASLIIGATPRQALNRDRRDYMLPDQLAELQRLTRQGMSLGSSLETRWVGFSPVTRSNWRKFTYNYSIVDVLPDGSVIQLGKCLGVEPVAEPVRR